MFKDVELSVTGNSIIAIDSSGIVKEYRPIIWFPLTPIQTYFREISFIGGGDKLIRTENNIWLQTGAYCTKV